MTSKFTKEPQASLSVSKNSGETEEVFILSRFFTKHQKLKGGHEIGKKTMDLNNDLIRIIKMPPLASFKLIIILKQKRYLKGGRTEIFFRVKANNRRMLRPTKAHGNDESEKLRAHLKKSMRYK